MPSALTPKQRAQVTRLVRALIRTELPRQLAGLCAPPAPAPQAPRGKGAPRP